MAEAAVRRPRVGGIVCPIATPTWEGRVRTDVLGAHLLWLKGQVDGVFLLGSSGEMSSLSSTLRAESKRIAADVPAGFTLYLGVGETSTPRVLEQLDSVPDRVDYMVVPAPYYFAATSQRALIDHFVAVADASPRPIVLYNLPQNTGAAIAPSSLSELAAHPNIVALKDSAGDMFAFSEFIRVAPSRISVMQGREQLAAISLWLGARGLMSSLANFAPRLLRELSDAVQASDRTEALAVQSRISDLARVFEQGHWVAALKAVLSELGLDVGDPIPPLEPCTPRQRQEVRRLLAKHGIAPILGGSGPGRQRPETAVGAGGFSAQARRTEH